MVNIPRCILICVGSELLRGKINTHASYISRRLASIGLHLNEEHTVSDERAEIASAIRRGLQSFDVVLVSGGLGPTFDDLTREAASDATGHSLELSPALLRNIQAKFRRARYRMPGENARQAYLLEGAKGLENHHGTAPGQWLKVSDAKVLVLLPGPPRELCPMLEAFVLPHLRKISPRTARAEAHLHFIGVPESIVDHKIRPIIARYGENAVQFTILAHLGLVDFDVFVSVSNTAHAQKMLNRIVGSVRRAMGDAWYGSDEDYPLEKVVGARFRKARATLATAESCTGGLLSARLTDVAGSSDYFVEGWVTYANTAKMRSLGVSESLLRKHGAVSKPVAIAMARGIRERAETTWGISITGIAGPAGGTPRKPVGLVYIALSSKNQTLCREYRFRGERDLVRQQAVLSALDLLRRI